MDLGPFPADNDYVKFLRLFPRLPVLLAVALLASCSGKGRTVAPQLGPPRTFLMGFSGIPPKPDLAVALAALDLWTRRADAAIMHFEPPWDSLLAGFPPDSAVILQHRALADYYRAKGLSLAITLDATNGLDRSAEAPALVAAGRSITEPAVQQLYRAYAVAVDTLLDPDYLGLAAETNLIRAAASPTLYAALAQMVNDAADDVRAVDPSVPLYISVQVVTAWGAFGGGGYQGIATDLADFPFSQVVGLSSYPYLGGFAEPEQLPLDYYSRLTSLPKLVVEGGWTSDTALASTPAEQARYLRRQAALLDQASAVAVFQLTFTDLDSTFFPPGTILPLFAYLGVVDVELSPKLALATWDSMFARPRF
jgi:hypothetical protein